MLPLTPERAATLVVRSIKRVGWWLGARDSRRVCGGGDSEVRGACIPRVHTLWSPATLSLCGCLYLGSSVLLILLWSEMYFGIP